MVTLALGHLTAPSTVTFFVAFHVPSSLNHGPCADAPPPPNVVRQAKIAPRAACVATLPSPTGSLVTSTEGAELVEALVVTAPLAVAVAVAEAVALVGAPLPGGALVEVAGAKVTFSVDPHADATMTATTHNALGTRRPDMTNDRTVRKLVLVRLRRNGSAASPRNENERGSQRKASVHGGPRVTWSKSDPSGRNTSKSRAVPL